MNFDRTKNAKRNIIWGLIMKIISLVIPFLMRTIIIYTLGTLYLGLNSLFTSILNALSLVELGIGSSLIFSMYKPVAEGDTIKIKALLAVYKRSYFVIGCVVVITGLALLPFLNVFISGSYPENINIRLIYLIQLFTTSVGYFFMAYKGSLLYAYQRTDIINKLTLITQICMYGLQIIGLIVFKSYYAYVLAQFFQILLFNLLQSYVVEKKFPELKAEGNISREDRKEIVTKTAALLGHNVAGIVINSADNILLSIFMGLEVVTIYNNYFYIITSLSGIFLMFSSSLNAIVGNYLVKEDNAKKVILFHTLHYLVCFAICICCTCLISLFQPFMTLWMGEKLLLPFSSVILFSLYFLSVKVRTIGLLFINAAGLWEQDVIKAWLLIVIDLVIDIWLLQKIGVNGAIVSSIVSMIFAYFYETRVIFKFCIKGSISRYYLDTFLYVLLACISCALAAIICNMLSVSHRWIKIPVYLVIAIILSVSVFIVGTAKTREYKYGKALVKEKLLMNIFS